MDLWIKSQDKELLVNAKGFELQQHYKDSPCQIFAVWNNNYNCVGTYKTKERALEVLDEIQNAILGILYTGFACLSKVTNCLVYEMPKE